MSNARRLSQLPTLASVCALIALLSACAHKEAPRHAQAIPVHTTTLVRGTIATQETLDGHVTPFFQSNLATEQAATIVAIYANEGDHIHQGEVLAKLDDSPLRAQLTEAQGSRVQAAAKLQQSAIQEPITSQTETSALAQAKSSLLQAQHQLLTDQAAIAQAKLTAEADRRLLAQGFVAEETERQAEAAYVSSQQTLRIDQEKVGQAQSALSAAQRNLLNVPLQQQVIAENRGAVTSAAGGEQLLSTQITQTTLTAPYDGVVTSRLLDPGAYASQSQPIFALAKIDPVYIDFNVHDTDLPFAQPQSAVTFTSPSIPGHVYHAKIASVDAVPVSGTLVYHTRLIVPNHDEMLRGGMLVNIQLTTAQHRDVLLAPRTAVTQGESGGEMFTVDQSDGNTVARLHKVTLGLQDASRIEVSGPGLRAGAQIIAARPDNLADRSVIAVSR